MKTAIKVIGALVLVSAFVVLIAGNIQKDKEINKAEAKIEKLETKLDKAENVKDFYIDENEKMQELIDRYNVYIENVRTKSEEMQKRLESMT